MDWIKAFPESELKEGGRRLVQASARRVLVIRFKDRLFAIESNCPHMRYPLKDARKAHEDLEARKTTGSLILIP